MFKIAKRGVLAVFASGLLAAASVAVIPASSASAAASGACKSYTVGGVSFSLCTNRVSSVRAQAEIIVTGGTYVSGTLYLEGPGESTDSGCSGKIYSGSRCTFSETDGSGAYQTVWYAASGKTYASPGLVIS